MFIFDKKSKLFTELGKLPEEELPWHTEHTVKQLKTFIRLLTKEKKKHSENAEISALISNLKDVYSSLLSYYATKSDKDLIKLKKFLPDLKVKTLNQKGVELVNLIKEQKDKSMLESEGSKVLKELLTYQNPNVENYDQLINSERKHVFYERKRAPAGDAYSQHFSSLIKRCKLYQKKVDDWGEEEYLFFKSKIKDSIVVDLGCGGFDSTMVAFCKLFQAKIYLGIDLYIEGVGKEFQLAEPIRIVHEKKEDDLYLIYVKADMLAFISKVKSNSINLTINGIDYAIIKNGLYHAALSEEIERTLKYQGTAFGVNADCLFSLRDRSGLKDIRNLVFVKNDRYALIIEKVI